MDNTPLISIIIPTFNRENVIVQALQSIITALPHEILVIDDGSQDQTETHVRQLALPNLKYIKHSFNQGAAAARNTGIQLAKGQYIAFLDSDDLWFPYKLDHQLNFLKSHPRHRACYSGFLYKKSSGKTEVRSPHQENWEDYLKGCFIAPGTTLFIEKGVFNDIENYSIELERLEDWDLLLRFSHQFSIGRLDRPLAIVRQSSPPPLKKVVRSAETLKKIFQIQVGKKSGKRGLAIFLGALEREKLVSSLKNKKYLHTLYYLKNFVFCKMNRYC